MILFFRHKRQDDLSEKNTWKYDIFLRSSGKMSFQEIRTWIRSFLLYLERWCLFIPENMIIFIWAENERRWSLSKKAWKYGIFCIYGRRYKHDIPPPTARQKNPKRCPCPEKIHIRVTSPALPKKMIFILENAAFLLKHHVD